MRVDGKIILNCILYVTACEAIAAIHLVEVRTVLQDRVKVKF